MIVIADDITGAAEIAGIAHSQGQPVQFVCGCPVDCGIAAVNGTTVIATDTRSMTEAEAIAETRHIASQISNLKSQTSTLNPQFFKKTDSALRGHVIAELSVFMDVTGYRRAIYLPANPSKGRVIRAGTYYINNVPIADTDFRFDPEFPAKASVLKECFPEAECHNIIMPDAESEADIKRIIATYNDGHTLFAGAADLFSALMQSEEKVTAPLFLGGESRGRLLVLCGSTQSKPEHFGIPVCEMPRAVYNGQEGADAWYASLLPTVIHQPHSLVLYIPRSSDGVGDARVAVRLRSVMAEMAKRFIPLLAPTHLVIEGGATAWATFKALGWTSFEVVRQIAPGVVQLRSDGGILVTLKPGSYPWGRLFQDAESFKL